MQVSVPLRAVAALAATAALLGTGAPHAEPAPALQAPAWVGPVAAQGIASAESAQPGAPASGTSEPSGFTLVLAGIGAAGWLVLRRGRADR
jgi:hypothetical protein